MEAIFRRANWALFRDNILRETTYWFGAGERAFLALKKTVEDGRRTVVNNSKLRKVSGKSEQKTQSKKKAEKTWKSRLKKAKLIAMLSSKRWSSENFFRLTFFCYLSRWCTFCGLGYPRYFQKVARKAAVFFRLIKPLVFYLCGTKGEKLIKNDPDKSELSILS